MTSFRRRLAAIAVSSALAALSIGTTTAAAASLSVDDPRTTGVVAAQATARARAACSDTAYNLYGGRWQAPLRWSFRGSSTPGYLDRASVLDVLKRSFRNITDARNDCGRGDNVSATAVYEGMTSRKPSVGYTGNCTSADGRNVIGFGDLPPGALAVTCTRFNGSRIVETDIRISTRFTWKMSAANCVHEELLEPTMTHELGHAFGLAHVGERRHGRLTMSTMSDGWCSNSESTLGLGDMLGLERLY